MIAAIVGPAAAPVWTTGQEIVTGADLRQACSDRSDQMRTLSCVYYLRGALAMASVDKQVMYDHYRVATDHRLAVFCPPVATTTFDMIATISKAISTDAALAGAPAARVAVEALKRVYPCT